MGDPGSTSPSPQARHPHAVHDPQTRRLKARKIAEILSRRIDLAGARVLEIGTGSGLIAKHFVEIVGPAGKVVGVDRVCQVGAAPAFQYLSVTSTKLPFDDEAFDVVISNHVIEHVGELADQKSHLREARRVLAPGGILYLAAPNRWAPLEPHFRLPFLSWLPVVLRSPYVRFCGRGDGYDCRLLNRREMRILIGDSGMTATDVTLEALQIAARTEIPGPLGKFAARHARALLYLSRPIIPTLVFLAKARN